jgi:hypothetical protein
MIPSHAGTEFVPGGAAPDGVPGGAAPDGVPGGAAGAWGGGAAGSDSVMTNQRYYAARLAQGALPDWLESAPHTVSLARSCLAGGAAVLRKAP